jgi:hypothetical protein
MQSGCRAKGCLGGSAIAGLLILVFISLFFQSCATTAAQSIQPSSSFTPSSSSSLIDGSQGVYYIGVEADLSAGFTEMDFPLNVPKGLQLKGLEGTVSIMPSSTMTICDDPQAEVLSNVAGYASIVKSSHITIFVHYTSLIPSSANLHIASLTRCPLDWEFQGYAQASN